MVARWLKPKVYQSTLPRTITFSFLSGPHPLTCFLFCGFIDRCRLTLPPLWRCRLAALPCSGFVSLCSRLLHCRRPLPPPFSSAVVLEHHPPATPWPSSAPPSSTANVLWCHPFAMRPPSCSTIVLRCHYLVRLQSSSNVVLWFCHPLSPLSSSAIILRFRRFPTPLFSNDILQRRHLDVLRV